ncbi:MAG: sulfatase, partial [Rhodothermales bacterium]|nr:sulfatase [Rhodothermales bacterium]
YAASPVCSPTRASILTGKNPGRLHTSDWFGAPQPDTQSEYWLSKPLLPAAYIASLPHDEVTVAEALREEGYRTFFAGKWHLGNEGSYPEDHGFEINKGGFERGGPYGGDRYFSPYGNPRLEDGPTGEHLPERLGRETADFIKNAAADGTPFFAYLSFYSVHTPLMTRPDLETKYAAKRAEWPDEKWGTEGDRKVRLVQNHAVYAGMVETMDDAVGVVLEALEAAGVADNTLVIFMSDNGGLSTSEGHPTSNLPFRAGKGWLYEGGIREPMIVRWPGVASAGSISEQPVVSMDFYPTMLDAAGLFPLPGQHRDGQSLLPALTGQTIDREALFFHYPHYGNQGGSPASAVRVGDYKLIRFFEDGREELYDLSRDVSERTDVAHEQEDLVQELSSKLSEWHSTAGVRLPSLNPAAQN